jgi:ABC-type glycerol-3-phosphate transport system substrate-binding protein
VRHWREDSAGSASYYWVSGVTQEVLPMPRNDTLALLLVVIVLLDGCAFGLSPVAPTPAPQTADAGQPDIVAALPATIEPIAAERVTITFGVFEYERPRYEPLIAAFEQDNPAIHVQITSLDPLFRGGEPDDPLRAVMSIADTHAGFRPTPEAIAQGVVRDLKPLIDADASFDPADFYAGALEAVSQGGGIYVLPRDLRIPLIFYNKDLWARRGLPAPQPGWTWPELKAAIQQLAQKRGDTVEVYGMLDGGADVALKGELDAAGVRTDESDGTRLDDPRVVGAFQHVADLSAAGAIYTFHAAEGRGYDERRMVDLIENQQLGMWSPDLCCYKPELVKPSFAVGTASFPSSHIAVHGYVMSGGTQHPEAAWRWLAFLSRHETSLVLQSRIGVSVVPARKSVAEQIGYWQQLEAENAAALRAALDDPAAWRPAGPPLAIFGEDPNGELYGNVLSAVLGGERAIRDVLREAQATVEQRRATKPSTPVPPEPIVVATPPQAPAGVPAIAFGAPSASVDQARRLAERFNADNPGIFVTVRDISPSSGNVSSDTRIRSLAEVVATNDCFSFFGPLDSAAVTATLDLQPLIDADPTVAIDDYPAALLGPFRRGTALHGLPETVYFRALHYNQAAFDAAGVAHPSADWTLDDLLAAAQRLSSGNGPNRHYGFASLGSQRSEVFFFLDRMNARETAGSGAEQRPRFTDPQVVRAARAYLDLLHAASPHARLQGYRRDDQRDDGYEPIRTGRAAMWFDFGLGLLGGMRAPPGFVHAVAPPPLRASAATANDFAVRALAISATTQQPEACWAWLKYLSGSAANTGGFPARRSLAESAAFLQQAPPGAAEVYRAYRAAFEHVNTADALPDRERSPIDYYWFFRALDRALGGADLERELADAQLLTEQFMVCVQGGAPASECATQVDPEYPGR